MSFNEMHNEMFSSPKFKGAREHFSKLPKIPKETYLRLHKKPIQKLGVSIDLDLFNTQVAAVKDQFQPWGINSNKDNRYGLALTEPLFVTDEYPDPANWPLDIWNYHHPYQPLTDADFPVQNKWFEYFTSLMPVYDLFVPHISRTNVTLWNTGGQFYPHIDNFVDTATNYRLWISNKTGKQHQLLFGNRETDKDLVNCSDDLIPGELYLLDTTICHHGIATEDFVCSMLMSVLPSATEIIEELLNAQSSSLTG